MCELSALVSAHSILTRAFNYIYEAAHGCLDVV
jgi:hypothetical protein